jgi:DNA-directed RNA polymerase subunit RPC12/RpoP
MNRIKTIINAPCEKKMMHVKCPQCGEIAELEDNFSHVKCDKCSLEISYGEYVKMIAYKDPRYKDVLNDYK